MAQLWAYISGVFLEGILVGVAFWIITYITLESTSAWAAVRAGLISEAVGNVPYLAGIGAVEPPALLMTLIGGGIFVWQILKNGELTFVKALMGLTMTYFFMIAIVACAPEALGAR